MAYNSDYSKPFSMGTFGDIPQSGVSKALSGSLSLPSWLTPGNLSMAASLVPGMGAVASGTATRPNNDTEQMTALQKLYAATQATNRTPQGRIDRGFSAFGPAGQMPQPTEPMLPTPPTPAPVDMGSHASPSAAGAAPQAPVAPVLHQAQASPLDTAQWPSGPVGAPAGVPMPMPRPSEAPQTPEMPWWQRNAAMMSDPSGGGFIDPEGSARAQASGPDVINKLMSYFHKKDDPSNG